MGDVSVSTETARWLRYLPLRWTAGAFFIVVVWSGLSGLLQGAFSDPVGGQLASAIRLLVNIVIPLIFLGFLWGFSERRRLEQAISNGQAAIEQSLRRSLLLNIAKAFVCGVRSGSSRMSQSGAIAHSDTGTATRISS